mmetsp:Transcript_23453/g.58315  ORF Transcript_23453/g.58315 Transcript_23453/m.58315 type:complete len:211 (+) Transcript_23453:147-779(+)
MHRLVIRITTTRQQMKRHGPHLQESPSRNRNRVRQKHWTSRRWHLTLLQISSLAACREAPAEYNSTRHRAGKARTEGVPRARKLMLSQLQHPGRLRRSPSRGPGTSPHHGPHSRRSHFPSPSSNRCCRPVSRPLARSSSTLGRLPLRVATSSASPKQAPARLWAFSCQHSPKLCQRDCQVRPSCLSWLPLVSWQCRLMPTRRDLLDQPVS